MAHVSSALPDDWQSFLEARTRLLLQRGMDATAARRRAYAEMLHRFVPVGQPRFEVLQKGLGLSRWRWQAERHRRFVRRAASNPAN